MARMTGGEAIVDSLLRHGIDTVFGLPGVQTYGLFDAFARSSNRLRLINARHEQGTAYMALGYACATGRPAVFAVVPGPGVLNTMAALATAWGVNAPVLCLTGQVPGPMIGRGHRCRKACRRSASSPSKSAYKPKQSRRDARSR
jgi:acetolactate synthase I/II/III large subunit